MCGQLKEMEGQRISLEVQQHAHHTSSMDGRSDW
jgi:hypothetical protein